MKKRDTKAKYSPFVDKRESLLKILKKREKQKPQQTKSENLSSSLRPGSKAFTGKKNLLAIFLKV